jgi:hypothetical protein
MWAYEFVHGSKWIQTYSAAILRVAQKCLPCRLISRRLTLQSGRLVPGCGRFSRLISKVCQCRMSTSALLNDCSRTTQRAALGRLRSVGEVVSSRSASGAARAGVEGPARRLDWSDRIRGEEVLEFASTRMPQLSRSQSLPARCCTKLQMPESRTSGAIRSDGAAADVEKSDHVGYACWSAVG